MLGPVGYPDPQGVTGAFPSKFTGNGRRILACRPTLLRIIR